VAQVRRLNKVPEPEELKKNAKLWTDEYVSRFEAGATLPQPWKRDYIVENLGKETHGKCAYCEGVIGDVSYPHVEHMIPKSRRPELVVDWNNLTIGCTVCNTNKRDYYEPDAPLLQPYADDPTDHLLFLGPLICFSPGSDKGNRTIQRLKLSRSELVTERMRSIQNFHNVLDRWFRAHGPDKDVWAEEVRTRLADDKEFVQTLRAHAEHTGFPVQQ
jgi:uncharacterized protein (TIGR02646 family)